MPRTKDETISICTTGEVKALLRQAAKHERRSVASMMEVLVLGYAAQHGLQPVARTTKRATRKKPI